MYLSYTRKAESHELIDKTGYRYHSDFSRSFKMEAIEATV